MPFRRQHVETAGGYGLFLECLNLVANGLFPGLTFRSLRHAFEFLADAHVRVAAELDVGTASGHVGGDGDRAGLAGLRHDEGFALVVAGVQHLEILDAVLA